MIDEWVNDRLHLLSWGPKGSASEAAPPLLLLHGIGESAADWIPFAARMDESVRLVALDLRGHGESAHNADGAYEHLDYLMDLLLVIDAIGSPVTVVGHSLSGHLGLFLAALCPHLVNAFVLVDVEAFPPRAQVEQLRSLGTRPHEAHADAEQALRRLKNRLPRVQEEILRRKIAHEMGPGAGGLVPRFDRAALRRLSSPDARPCLAMIRQPMLIIRGAESEVMRVSAAREMERAVRSSRLREIARTGHFPHLERPDAFSSVITEFIREVDLG